MKPTGWVSIWRKLCISDLWLNEKFTRGQAWVDLLLLANHEKGEITKRGITVFLERGDVGWSERELASRWKWSRGKVRRFIKYMCSGSDPKLIPQTSPQNTNIINCYTIINYKQYQDNSPQNKPQTGHKQYLNNNDNNENNKIKQLEYPDWLNKNLWREFKLHRKGMKGGFTLQAEKVCLTKLKKLKEQGFNPDMLMNETIEKSWKTFYKPKGATKGSVKSHPTQKADVHILGEALWILNNHGESKFKEYCKLNNISPADQDILRKKGG